MKAHSFLSLLPAAILRLVIDPDRPRPTGTEIIRQTAEELPPARRPLAAEEWFAQLEEHLPRAYLYAVGSELDELRVLAGASPQEAAAYARAYLMGPRIVSAEDEKAAGVPRMAAPLA